MCVRRAHVAFAIALTFAFVPIAAQAAVYSYVDSDGVIHFTDVPKDKRFKLFFDPTPNGPRRAARWGGPRMSALEVDQFVKLYAEQNDISDQLVHAIIKAESDYDPKAVSPSGAMGLMQLMPLTAQLYDVFDAMEPSENIRAGTAYLRYLYDVFDGDLRLAIAGYNAGPTAVMNAGYRIPNYPETQTYVKRVLGYYRQFLEDGIGR